MKVGVISDTHGLLRPEVLSALEGCKRIIHAGDVGKVEVLEQLRTLAPTVVAVRGNVDRGAWAEQLPGAVTLKWADTDIHVIHDRADFCAVSAGLQSGVVISGHSHRASIETERGILYLNPGSIGPRRFRLPVSMACLHLVEGLKPRAEVVTLLL